MKGFPLVRRPLTSAAMDMLRTNAAPEPVRRADYRPPEWLVPEVALDFALDAERTLVTARLSVERSGDHGRPLRLDGDGLSPVSVTVDGTEAAWRMDGATLVVDIAGDRAVVETVVEISPAANTKLMGLYASGGNLTTQCEAEGFRRISFFPDRPDILSRYRVRMSADKARYPVLLSNGNRIDAGDGPDGTHWALWEDPFPKPCYLFALVAGRLVANRDRFTTVSGRAVDLAIWVREGDEAKTEHAMAALKASMAWDEAVYGREYDLDQFNIVAVDDFNFGAMENKSLNIFNSRYILADPDTATDADFDAIAAVVAHEYFHNWSGNRVTCRDWFQLSLKEGFTVYRDQSFSADQGSAAVKRIEDVRALRAVQFQEDAGPLAHPVRPETYLEISNFYTATIYNKGAELIRMMATLLGPERFRAATDLYFQRHDGEAATCEDFVRAMEDGGGIDLTQFRLWYEQAGTPRIEAHLDHDPATATATLHFSQTLPPTPGQPVKQPMHIPVNVALFGRDSGRRLGDERLVELTRAEATVTLDGIDEPPVLSINRGFSAPVVVATDRDPAALAFLSGHDDDPFARYEAMQQLMLDTLIRRVAGHEADEEAVVAAVARTLADPALDKAFVGEAVLLPSEAFIADQLTDVDPEAVHRAREGLRGLLGRRREAEWRAAYAGAAANSFSLSPSAKGARRLRSVALGYVAAGGAGDAAAMAFDQFNGADNMTDRQGALGVLASLDAPERRMALDAFHARYAGDALVIDKWFSVQAMSKRDDTLEAVMRLAGHSDFNLGNPNRLRALVGAFAANQRAFHAADGRGYGFLREMIVDVDRLNPQAAARLVTPLGRWRRFEPARADLMRAELDRIAAVPNLSKDVFEQVSKSLA